MKAVVFVLALFGASPLSAQQSVVEAVKADLIRRGISLQGECGAFAIVQRVAWMLRAQGYGLVAKPGGANCQGYSTDLIQSPTVWVDILSDAGGLNAPQWNAHPDVTPSMWRAPFDPQDVPVTPPGPIPAPLPPPLPVPPPVPPIDLSGVLSRIAWTDENTERRYLDLKAEAQAAAAREAALAAALAKHDADHGVLYDAATNRYLQIGLAILGTLITQQQVTK